VIRGHVLRPARCCGRSSRWVATPCCRPWGGGGSADSATLPLLLTPRAAGPRPSVANIIDVDAQDRRPPADRGVRRRGVHPLGPRTVRDPPAGSSRESSPGPSRTCARWSGGCQASDLTGPWPPAALHDPGKAITGSGAGFRAARRRQIARADVAPSSHRAHLGHYKSPSEWPGPRLLLGGTDRVSGPNPSRTQGG